MSSERYNTTAVQVIKGPPLRMMNALRRPPHICLSFQHFKRWIRWKQQIFFTKLSQNWTKMAGISLSLSPKLIPLYNVCKSSLKTQETFVVVNQILTISLSTAATILGLSRADRLSWLKEVIHLNCQRPAMGWVTDDICHICHCEIIHAGRINRRNLSMLGELIWRKYEPPYPLSEILFWSRLLASLRGMSTPHKAGLWNVKRSYPYYRWGKLCCF